MGSRISEILNNLLPFGSMTPHVQEILNTYLLPIAIAIPLAILLYFLGTRKGDDAPASRFDDQATTRREPVAAPVSTPAVAPLPPAMTGTTVEKAAAAAARHAPPVLTPAQVYTPPPAVPSPETVRPALLIVEDSAVARTKLVRLFQAAGYQVEAAVDGVDAMDKLGAGFYSVLITDLEMPNMNGLELISAVQGSLETEDLPIIAITGHDELGAHVHQYQGLYGIYKKPWNDRELLKRVETLSTMRKRPTLAS